MAHDEMATALRAAGHRVTRPRRAVWDALSASGGHVTVDELAARVTRTAPGTNLASVYRALATFAELGLARETRLGDEAGRWELAHPDEHFHLVCERCGSIEHHVGSLVEQVRTHLRDGHGFRPRTVDLTVTGTCAGCS